MDISVIVPTKDRPENLKRAICSLFIQTILPDEVIIINDGSQLPYDNVLNEIKSFNPGVIIKYNMFKQSIGAAEARNTGANLAGGEILMFLDDDDYWGEGKIENQLVMFQNNPEIGLVYSAKSVVDETGRFLYYIKSKKGVKNYSFNCPIHNITRLGIGTTSAVALRKVIFDKSGGFDKSLPARQDTELWARISSLTKIAYVDSPDVYYTISRKINDQISSSVEKVNEANRIIIAKYNNEISKLTLREKKKLKASFKLSVAKRYSSHNFFKAAWYSLQSFVLYPSTKSLVYLFPHKVINYFRSKRHRK